VGTDTIPAAGDAPEVSVVIPTKGRDTRLAFALDALAGQTLGQARFEVIVVRASGPEEPPISLPPGLAGRVISDSSLAAVSAKRNTGWRAANAPLVAFTDDDCRPAPDWLETLLGAARGTDVILQGRTEPDPDERHLLHGLARSQEIIGPSDWYETCNMAYHRELLEAAGGFDEGFFWGGEDTDLALRVLASGARRQYVDGAVVWHAVRPQHVKAALRGAIARSSQPAVIARHPQQRRALNNGLFAERTHGPLLLALAGAAIFRRNPLIGALASVPYLRVCFERFDRRRGPVRGTLRLAAHIAGRLPVDLVETAAVARSAVRHRTLVL
jgi:cellulose synthase/poly-beta-1,6-N-acetylglucosamine synthase-like glycosyltransferase